jgi:hypothetical protein
MTTACAPRHLQHSSGSLENRAKRSTAFIEIWCETGWTSVLDRSFPPSTLELRRTGRSSRARIISARRANHLRFGHRDIQRIEDFPLNRAAISHAVSNQQVGSRIETKIDRIHKNVGDISQKWLDFLFIF